MTRPRMAVLALIAVFLFALPAFADDDPPARAGRLNYLSGEVSFQPGGVDEWVAATLNRPLTTGDRLWTDRDARAELHLGGAALRLGAETSFTLANLDDRNTQIQLAQGTLSIRLRRLADDETFEVDTPNLTFTLQRPGEYRVDVDNEGGTTVVTVRAGAGEVAGSGQTLSVHAGQQARFSGGENGVAELNDAPGADTFDEWCRTRDRREDQVQSARYVSPDVVGYEDLDGYGVWREEAAYGIVWMPRVVVVGWAPYRYGHWAWVYPWGWTWIDDAPWGFAPFHYGRWVYLRGHWGWVPGPRHVRPVYAPALVAWVGGNNWGIGISIGHRPVGWFPLGPREVYVPAYRASRTYVTNVNITNTTVTNVHVINVYDKRGSRTFVNQHVRGAVTAVPEDTFINSRPVHRTVLKVREDQIRRIKVVDTVAVAPAQRSLLGREETPGRRPPERAFNRPVVARRAPPAPVPFEAQRRSVAADGSIRPARVREFPEMRRPQIISPDRPANAGRALPQRRADSETPKPRRAEENTESPVARPAAREVPRPVKERTPDEVRGPRRVTPRPQENAAPPVAQPAAREVPRPVKERMPDEERGPRRVVPRPQENAAPPVAQPAAREVPRPAKERTAEEERGPRRVTPRPQENAAPPVARPAAREEARPAQVRPSEAPRQEVARPAREEKPAAREARPAKQKPAEAKPKKEQKSEDKPKSKPDGRDR